MATVSVKTLSLRSISNKINANNILIRDTIVGAYVETEQSIIKTTLAGAYAESELRQLDVTLVGMYVEVQEEEMIYETVIVPEGIGALYQNVPLITIMKR